MFASLCHAVPRPGKLLPTQASLILSNVSQSQGSKTSTTILRCTRLLTIYIIEYRECDQFEIICWNLFESVTIYVWWVPVQRGLRSSQHVRSEKTSNVGSCVFCLSAKHLCNPSAFLANFAIRMRTGIRTIFRVTNCWDGFSVTFSSLSSLAADYPSIYHLCKLAICYMVIFTMWISSSPRKLLVQAALPPAVSTSGPT